MNTSRTYTQLIRFQTFEERFRYLKLDGQVANETFGFDRYLNQVFYNSEEWKSVRRKIIIRDNGCDLGVPGYEIHGNILVHHLIPISKEQVLSRDRIIFDPEFLICTSLATHNAIHYGDMAYLDKNKVIVRSKNDTCPWKTQ